MIKVYFKYVVQCTKVYDNKSCCAEIRKEYYKITNIVGDICDTACFTLMNYHGYVKEKFRCLVNVSYAFSNSSLEYYEYVDWCYNLFNFEQMEDLLSKDGIEVIFLEED